MYLTEQSEAANDVGAFQVCPSATEDMIEAGLKVFMGWHPDTAVGDKVDRDIVREIYEAMALAARRSVVSGSQRLLSGGEPRERGH
jgi:hypothetical protein